MAQSNTMTTGGVAAHLEAAVQALPSLSTDDQLGKRLHVELARCLITAGKPDVAGLLVDTVLEKDALHSGAQLLKIDAAVEAGDTERALSAIETARPSFQTEASFLRKKLWALRRGSRQPETAPVLEALHELEPQDANLLIDLGGVHAKNGNAKDARHAFLRALTIDRANTRAWLGLVDAATKLGGPMDARESAEQALAAVPEDLRVVEKVARARIAAGRHDEARALLEETIAGCAAPPGTLRLALALACRKHGDFDAAERQHEAVLAENPHEFRAWTSRIQAALEQGDIDLALKHCGPALSACPDNPDLVRQRADVLRRAGSYGDAVAALEALHRQRPEDQATALSLAGALRQAGRAEEADRLYEDILRINPENWPALQGRVAIAEGRGDFELALKLLDGAPPAAAQ